ncbi:MAG: FG-GAP-like repeat-containing protein, partial [Bacteroidota bacterium]
LYTANDRFTRNTLLKNNGDGTFSDNSIFSGTALAMNAMCVAPGDYNNDGWVDIYVTNTQQGNALLRNTGNESFISSSIESGTAFFEYCWGALFFDADNDGWEDLYVSGMLMGPEVLSSAFYHNQQDGTFIIPEDAGFQGDTVRSFNNAIGDINQDGLSEIMVINTAPYFSNLWVNSTNTTHNWIKIKLEGVLSNRDGIGSRIEVYTSDGEQLRFTTCGNGFLGQNSETLTIGVGTHAIIDSITIKWPTGHVDLLTAVVTNQTLQVQEGSTSEGIIQVDEDVNLLVATDEPVLPTTNIQVFPNPTKGTVTILTPNYTQAFQLYLFHSNGQFQQAIPIDSSQVHFSMLHLPKGIYWLMSPNGETTAIVKQ